MLMACNIAAWQSRRMRKLGSNFAAIDVWAHFPALLFIGCSTVDLSNSRQDCRGTAESPRKVFRGFLVKVESLSRMTTMI